MILESLKRRLISINTDKTNEVVTSSQNKLIKHVKALSVKKYRDEHGEYIIEGIKLIKEALDYNVHISAMLVSAEKSQTGGIVELTRHLYSTSREVNFVDERLFREISETETPQGIMAIVSKGSSDIEGLLERDMLNILLLDEVRDPGNLGTIIRTADACGLDAVLLSKGCADVYSGKVVRSTMGSIFHIPIITGLDAAELLSRMEAYGILTIGADPYGEVICTEIPRTVKNAIVIGNEANGLSDSVRERLKTKVRIPMPGKAESLNAGIAAAIMMYEIAVRRNI